MADEEPKQLKDIVNEISSKMKSKSGASFEERIEAFKEFHDPKKEYDNHFIAHANEIFIGSGSDVGVYHETYKHLDSKIPEVNGKVSKDVAEDMIEKYVDSFLSKTHKDYDKILAEVEEKGLSKDEVKELKENLFNLYVRDEKGNPIRLKDRERAITDKSKLEAKQYLKSFTDNDSQMYASISIQKATRNLIDEHDIYDLHKHIEPKLEDAKFKPIDNNLTKDVNTLAGDYQTLIKGGDLSKRGYKKLDLDYKEAA